METLNHTQSPQNDFAAFLEAELMLQPAEERVMAPELLYAQPEAADHTAEDFEAWSLLFSANGNTDPANQENYAYASPESRYKRLKSAARTVGSVAVTSSNWLMERLPEIRISPKLQRNLGRLAAGAVAGILLANTLQGIVGNHISLSAKPARPATEQNINPLIPKADLHEAVPDAPELQGQAETLIPGLETDQPKIDLNTIYQQRIAENARIDLQLAQDKAEAEAAEAAKTAKRSALAAEQTTGAKGDCEQYRPMVEKYPWPVEAAMLTMKMESGCNPDAVSDTDDHGLFQLNGRRVYDPERNIRIAYGLYEDGRIGSENFSAWYAVCTEGNNPQPKYAGIHCQ